MKKKHLKIADLEIKSFVTSMKDETADTVKGGDSVFGGCDTVNGFNRQPVICQNTIYPDQSLCNPACITNIVEICDYL
ncbi:MAG: pinensin family lanthipeptide [Bacteroidota bacterium]